MEEKESGNQKKQSKKRARNPSEWKREKRKRLRIAGKEYVNSRGDIVNERKIGEDCKCRRKCYSLVPEDQRNKLFDGYYSLNSHDEQNAYLFGLIRKHDIARKRCKESDRRTCSYKYYVRIRGKEVQICRLAFAHIHGISPHKIRILCQKQDQNVMFPRDGRGKHSNRPRKIPEDTLSQIKDHIYSIISSDQVCGFLREEKHNGPDLNITKMWKDYLAKHDPNYKDMFSEKDEIDISKEANGMNIETECQLMADFTDAELTDEHPNHTYSTTMDLSEYPIASVADSLGLLDQPAESEFCTENETSSETLNKRNKYIPIVKHWLYSKVFHEEFKVNDLMSFKKKSHLKELSKAPSNSQGSKSERKQRTPKKISREKETCISMKVVEPALPIDSVPPLVETPAADLQNINIGQSADMYILPNEGAVVLRGIFSPYWIETVQKGIKKNLQNPSKYAQWLKTSESSGVYFNDYCNWKRISEFTDYIKKSPAAQIAAELTQSKEVRFYHEHVLEKSPGTEKQTPWHQDQPYYPINGSQVCSIWMPVDSIPFESSLQLISGSHKWNRWFKPRMFATLEDYDLIGESQHYESMNVDEMSKYPVLQWAVEPGDCVAFHMLTVHGAAGNTSMSNHRRVLATRWLGDDVYLNNRPWQVSPPLEAVFSDPLHPSLEELPLAWTQGRLKYL